MWGLPGYLHQRGIAYAYEKDIAQALKFLDAYLRKERFPSQRFWFDASRIVAVRAAKLASLDAAQSRSLALLSLECLNKALLLAKAPTDNLAVHPDFTYLRSILRNQFDDLLNTRPYAQQLLSAAPTKPDTSRPPPLPPEKRPGRLLVKGSQWVGDLKTSNKNIFEGCVLRITDREGGQLKGTLSMPMPMNKGMRVIFPVTGTLKNGEVELHTGKPDKGESKLKLHFTGRVDGPNLHLKGKGQGHAGREITVEFPLKHRGS
jgi:hypothetical protein